MSFSKHIDKMIGEAIERGEFKDLEGEGKPIDLDAYFATPQELRIGYSVLKSSKFVPEEIDRMKEIGEINEKLASCPEEHPQTDQAAPRTGARPCTYSRAK